MKTLTKDHGTPVNVCFQLFWEAKDDKNLHEYPYDFTLYLEEIEGQVTSDQIAKAVTSFFKRNIHAGKGKAATLLIKGLKCKAEGISTSKDYRPFRIEYGSIEAFRKEITRCATSFDQLVEQGLLKRPSRSLSEAI